MIRLAVAASLVLMLGSGNVRAHEFWISPEMYRWPAGETVSAHLRVGEAFLGAPRSFIPRNFERFEILTAEGPLIVEGRIGALPALSAVDVPEGLAIIVHETISRDLTWQAWDRFEDFAEQKGLGDVVAMHEERGLERTDVREDYVRYAKSLVAIGHGEGEDRPVGLRAELVALANPYTDDLAGVLPVQLWLDGEPRRTAQVEVFERPSVGGEAAVSVYRTDSNGIVVLPVAAGMQYLVNAVALEPVDGTEGDGSAGWRTLWASLTFEVPETQNMP